MWADRFTGKAAGPPEVSEAQGTDWSAFIWDLPQRSHARLTEPGKALPPNWWFDSKTASQL